MPQKTLQRYSFLSGREKQTQEKTPLPTEKDKNHSKTPLSQTPPFNPTPPHSLFHFRHGPPCTVPSRKFLIIHLEVSIILFTFVPVMLGQASAIKARNQVFEYPPISKLAGCFLYHGTGCKDTNISSFHQLFLLLSFVLYIRHHLYSTSTTYPLFRFHHYPYSASATTLLPQPLNRRRRHRQVDIDDIG